MPRNHPQQYVTPAQITERRALTLVSGGSPGLTPAQQDLLRIFRIHLQCLPACQWNDPQLSPVSSLLKWFFRYCEPSWKPTEDGSYFIDDLPKPQMDRFLYLKHYASSQAPQIDIEDVKLRAEIASIRKRAIDAATEYENLRQANGLPPDPLLTVPVTPLEIAAHGSYEENHQGAHR